METKNDCENFLPSKVLTRIFQLVEPRTLVFSCRLVCKFWKHIVESSDVWKIQIRRHVESNDAVMGILPTAHEVYPWYMCYVLCKNIFCKNLFPQNIPAGCPQYWAVDEFNNPGGMIYSVPARSFILGFGTLPEELLEEGMTSYFLSTTGECSVNHTIDLYEQGFTRKIMELNPPIVINEWFTVRQDFVGHYYLEVVLFNSEWDPDYQEGQFQYKQKSETMQWHHVTHAFINYRPDIRYVTFHHGVKISFPSMYGQVDPRDPGSKMAGAKVMINLPEPPASKPLVSEQPKNHVA